MPLEIPENLKKELRDEVCARRRDVEDFEQTRDHKLADCKYSGAGKCSATKIKYIITIPEGFPDGC